MHIDSTRFGMALGHEVDMAKDRVAEAQTKIEGATNPVGRFIGNCALRRSTKVLNYYQTEYDNFFATLQAQIAGNEALGGEV